PFGLFHSHWPIHNLFTLAIPVHLLPFAIRTRSHNRAYRVPEARLDMSVGLRVARAHAVNPVTEVRLAVVTLMRGRQLPFPARSVDQLGLPFLHHLGQAFESIEWIRTRLLGDEKPARAAFPTLRVQSSFFPTDTGVVPKAIAIAG